MILCYCPVVGKSRERGETNADYMPPHFHAYYGEYECCVDIDEIEKISGDMPNKQLKMILGWAALHQEELKENWYLARQKETLYQIEPLK